MTISKTIKSSFYTLGVVLIFGLFLVSPQYNTLAQKNTDSLILAAASGGASFEKINVPTAPTEGLPTDLGQLISDIFTWSLRIVGIAVFVMVFYAGFLWVTAAGNTGRVSDAKSKITNAVIGAVLLFSSYLILYTINPDLVEGTFTLPGIGTTGPTSGTTGTTGGASGGTCPAYTYDPATDCSAVDSNKATIMSILTKYPATNAGITSAIADIQKIYPWASIVPHPGGDQHLDVIDFGNGMFVDVMNSATGTSGKWQWSVTCACNR